jgi:Icc-related predicted phosphoesterase
MTIKIALFSDLHLDFCNFAPERFEADIAVLAGDIVEVAGGSPIAWAKANIPVHIPTIFVPGNHDFYGGRLGNLLNRWRAQAKDSHVTLLYNEQMNFNGYQILGTPLWSGLDLCGPVHKALLQQTLARRIADFSCMNDSGGGRWSIANMLREHELALNFLKAGLDDNPSAPKIVITHWAPAAQSIHSQFEGDDLNPYFVNDFPEMVEKAVLWMHGHTHEACDYVVGSAHGRGRVVCNPRGYPGEKRGKYEVKIIELE